jgi:predicted nucleic acid-binding protein
MLVVSDSSPLNLLVRIGYTDILRVLFHSVVIPPAVAAELSHVNTPHAVRSWIAARQEWLTIKAPSHIDPTLQLDDVGEAEAISLALELKADLLLADDRKARRIAEEKGLMVTGAIGVLELASFRHLLNLNDAFDKIRHTDFRVADRILRDALDRDSTRRRKDS